MITHHQDEGLGEDRMDTDQLDNQLDQIEADQ